MSIGISPRLLSAAELVRQDAVFADVGTDHAYLPIFLLEQGRILRAVCSDINRGPLDSARRNAAAAGLSDRISFHLTNGAAALCDLGITDYAVCGMGGELIADILEAAPHTARQEIRLLLQPMTKQEHLRRYLYSNGFEIKVESYSFDSGKYYVCFCADYTGIAKNLSDFQAYCGDENSKFVNNSAQIGYIEAKIQAIQKAIDGKLKGGLSAEEDIALLESVKGFVQKIKTAPYHITDTTRNDI